MYIVHCSPSFPERGNGAASHHAPYLLILLHTVTLGPAHELRLYNGLITLPHFREALSRWGHLLSNRAAPSSEALRSLGAIVAARLDGHVAQRSLLAHFVFLFLPFFPTISRSHRKCRNPTLFLFACSVAKCCANCFLPEFV